MHKALYRTYRPQFFREVVGQVTSTRVFLNAIMKLEITHAYLFTGPRGTGKTTIAKILAKAVNCLSPEDGEPCGKCENCKQSSPADIIEIDAASNNGVDEIREIRENVKYAPSNGRFKVYIIDEVHMLTIAAFNALLKTLEEPPKHVIFILATTEPHKVPLTIISRCQRYDFKRISIKDIVGRMKSVLDQEHAKAEDNALELIARVAQGGMRDALSLLDQAISHSEGTVTIDDVIAITGTVGLDLLTKTIKLIHNKKTSEVLDVVNQVIEGGKEPHFFLEDLLSYYRDIVIYQVIGEKADLSKAMLDETFVELAKKIPSSTIYSITDVLNDKLKEIRYSSQNKVLLELALVQVCQPSVSVDPLLKEQLKKEILQELGREAPQASTPTQDTSEASSEKPTQEKEFQQKEDRVIENSKQPEEEPVDGLGILDLVASELKESEETNPTDPPEEPIDYQEENSFPPTEDFLTEGSPAEEPLDFVSIVQDGMDKGEDWIEVIDDKQIKGEDDAEILTILHQCNKSLKHEYNQKHQLVLDTLKESNKRVFKLFSELDEVTAVSENYLVLTFGNYASLPAEMLAKNSNQKVMKVIFNRVLGRELEIKTFTKKDMDRIKEKFKKQLTKK